MTVLTIWTILVVWMWSGCAIALMWGTLPWLMCRRFPWFLPQQEIGWTEIGEEFTRFTLLKTPWFRVYLHRLLALTQHEHCHDHPWDFISLLLWGGYSEFHDGTWTYYRPGSLLYRPAEWQHIVATYGVSWSLIVTGGKRRAWGFMPCGGGE